MANFSDKISLTIDVITGKSASSPLKGIRDDIDQAEGSFGKLKAGASGVFDSIKANAGTFALGAGAAVAGFAVKAVGDFQDVALAAGKFSEATGLSTEDASRFVEVAEDLGIGVGNVEKTIGFMNRTLGQTPGKFKDAGVEIARTRDGAVDVVGTFENVVGVLNSIEDPSKRAAVAQQLLGRSWMESAELIGLGADGVKDALAGVEDAKVISPEQVEQARRFRDALDELKGVGESLTLELGNALVPVLSDLVGVVTPVAKAFAKLKDSLDALNDVPVANWIAKSIMGPMALARGAVEEIGDVWDSVFGPGGTTSQVAEVNPGFVESTRKWNAELASMSDEQIARSEEMTRRTIEAFNDQSQGPKTWAQAMAEASASFVTDGGHVIENTESMTAAAKVLTDQQDRLADSAKNVAEIMRDQADALEDQIAAAEDAAGATLSLADAQDDFVRAVQESNAKQKDAKATSEEKSDAVKAERDAMIKAAEAARAKADADAVASGATQSATGKVDSYNTSLLNNARFATPQAQAAIADYIIEANQVPASKATDIKAAIARGDFDTAKVLLDQASATRTAAIKADATNTAAASAELDAVANKNRTAAINASVGKVTYRAGGGTVRPGEDLTVVGEEGPELVSLPAGSHVYPNGQAPSPRAGAGSSSGTPLAASGGPTNITVIMPPGSDGRDVVRQIKRYERYNGTDWRR